MHILVIMRLGAAKTHDKLRPLLQCEAVQQVTLIRHEAIALESPKLRQVIHQVGLQGNGQSSPQWISLRNLIAAFRNAWRIARREQPDAVLAFNLLPYGVIAWAVARLTARPLLISLIGTDFDVRLKQPLLGWGLKQILKASDRVIIFGEAARQHLISQGIAAERIFTLPNTVDTAVFYPDASVIPDTDLIYVGNLHPFKRVDVLLQALQTVRQSRPETTLRVVGEGPARADLEVLAQTLGLATVATFMGWSNETAKLLRRSRILLLLSEHEGQPTAMIEAMSCGLPVIVTAVGAVPALIRDGKNGYLVSTPADPQIVADRIQHLLNEPELYAQIRENGLTVRQTHPYERAVEIWTEILSGL